MKCSKTPTICVVAVVAVTAAMLLGNLSASHVSAQVSASAKERPEYEDERWAEADEELEFDSVYEEFELKIAECELEMARIDQMAEIAADALRSSAFVITRLTEIAASEVASQILMEALSRTDSPAIDRLIRIQLLHLYSETERPEQAAELARELISGN